MTVPADPEFDSDVRRRIYEYVERNGASTPDEVLDAVRVEADSPGSKPARSGRTTRVRMNPRTFASHLSSLVNDGYVVEDDGKLRVGVESEAETVELDDGETATIRLARESDGDDVADVIREVTSERTYVVAESVAEALDDEPVVRHTNRRSRVVFVATLGEADP
ncbi:GNAT family N-acetyltransferase, partial [Halobacteriales archaeon QS_1_68_20]